ncbi:MAG: 3-phosphoshikimate 1-carboxyvinyltransferase [Pseudomonadota bacterium]
MVWTSHPVPRIVGQIRAPGDKSCSHRALILASLAKGTSTFSGMLEGDDVLRTAGACRALGAGVERLGVGRWEVIGRGGFLAPSAALDFGNSGTGSRLMMGAVAGFPIDARFIGDESLSGRPMGRIIDPLTAMGAKIDASDGQRLPLVLTGRERLSAIDYAPPKASAQVKSAVLLAGLRAEGRTVVREASDTRDHTERMLRAAGAELEIRREGPGGPRIVSLEGGQALSPLQTAIPGDPSSAAFPIAAGLISADGNVLVEGVMSNDTRSGLYDVLAARMGAVIGADEAGDVCGERTIDLHASSGGLKGTDVPPRTVPSMIDEFPILAVIAAFAEGETRVSGAEELRVKETDRIAATVDMLRVNGVEAEALDDGFVVQGCGGPPPGGGVVETRHDHRIAMSALVMGTAAQSPVAVDDLSMIETSYPRFVADMAAIGAEIRDVAA